jgi:putative acetyltransferase
MQLQLKYAIAQISIQTVETSVTSMASSNTSIRIKQGELNGPLCNMFRDKLMQHILSLPGHEHHFQATPVENSPRKMTLPEDSIFLYAETGTETSPIPVGSISLIRIHSDSQHSRGLPSGLDRVGEIKRMIVFEDHRGMGVGRKLIEALEAIAREELWLKYLVVETIKELTTAQGLYEKAGYGRREVWGLYDESSFCYEKWL